MPADEINHTEPERFQSGTWCATSQRLIGEGDISASYSADRIGAGEPVRKPFRWKGALWTSIGMSSLGSERIVTAYRLVPAALFDGDTRSYAKTVADGEAARSNPLGFYHGMEVRHGGKPFVISGKPEEFAPSQSEQLALF